MRIARASATCLVVALVGAWALGGGARAASAPDPCSVLRADEISRALGQPAAEGTPGQLPNVCDWALAARGDRPAGSVHVLFEHGARARRSFKLAKRYHVDDRERIAGLGKRAFYAPTLGTVWVLRDRRTLFYVQGLYPSGTDVDLPALRDALVGLARLADARIESR